MACVVGVRSAQNQPDIVVAGYKKARGFGPHKHTLAQVRKTNVFKSVST
jgi:hypothetical protein